VATRARLQTKAPTHHREFVPRFRRHAFGWRSQPAINQVNQAVAEIKRVARTEALLRGEGAVMFLHSEREALDRAMQAQPGKNKRA
jgi:hypothetical protein